MQNCAPNCALCARDRFEEQPDFELHDEDQYGDNEEDLDEEDEEKTLNA